MFLYRKDKKKINLLIGSKTNNQVKEQLKEIGQLSALAGSGRHVGGGRSWFAATVELEHALSMESSGQSPR